MRFVVVVDDADPEADAEMIQIKRLFTRPTLFVVSRRVDHSLRQFDENQRCFFRN